MIRRAPGIPSPDTQDLEERGARDRELFSRLPDPAAREELVQRYTLLSSNLARRFGGRGEPVEDLIQVANIGLLNAIDRFDPDRGTQFSTYATATIVGELKRHFRDKGWSLRVPRRLQESALSINASVSELWQQLGRSPTVREVASHAELSEDEVVEAMGAVQAYATTPLDVPVDEQGATVAQRLGEEDGRLETLEGWASVSDLIRALPTRERRVLYLRFFKDMTQGQIAAELGISQMHVSRLLSRTLASLREGARSDDPDGEE